MNHIPRSSAWLIIFITLFASACNSSISPSQENATKQAPSPNNSTGAVQILTFETSSSTITSTYPLPTHTPTSTQKLLPSPIVTPATITPSTINTLEKETASPTPECTNQAEFVKHLSIGDFTKLQSGQYFAKIWRIKNVGTCLWTQDYALVFFNGNNMNGSQSVPLSQDVTPGETVDLRIDLIAPDLVGIHSADWVLQDSQGHTFGLGEAKDQPLSVNIVIVPTPLPTPGCAKCQAEVEISR